MVRRLTILLSIACLAACVSRTDRDAVLAQNQRLRAELEEVRAEMAALTAEPARSEVIVAGTETRVIESSLNGQRYLIKVKLPRGYEDGAATYPVLYVTDAETNFGGVSYIVQRLIKDELIPEILVVGVAYDTDYDDFYRLRSRDLTPVPHREVRISHGAGPDPTGGALQFSRFLSDELFPLVEDSYRVTSGDRALYGHSYGGLFGSWVLLHRPQLFRRYLLLSPSLWFDDQRLLAEVETADPQIPPTRLYMASGRLEPRIDDLQVEFVDLLRRRNRSDVDIYSEVLDGETHRTIFGRGFTNGLRYIYSGES